MGVTGRWGWPLRRRVGVRSEVGVRERLSPDLANGTIGDRLSLANASIPLICLPCSVGRGGREVGYGGGVSDDGNATLSSGKTTSILCMSISR